jgi:hypothetical protein
VLNPLVPIEDIQVFGWISSHTPCRLANRADDARCLESSDRLTFGGDETTRKTYKRWERGRSKLVVNFLS